MEKPEDVLLIVAKILIFKSATKIHLKEDQSARKHLKERISFFLSNLSFPLKC